ncbi:MAG: S-layer homology domain-containing protein [Clostridiales bacterium]|nr:S-layer homology domain-containing protein [Clostridiales bacterium]
MKRKTILSILIAAVITCLLPVSAMAVVSNVQSMAPYDLEAAELPVDETHPAGSALLSFKIDNLPGDTGDSTLTWYVGIEKKIGAGEWIGVELIPSATMLADHQKSLGVFAFEQLWIEDYNWDGTKAISYRVYVSLEDLVSNRGGKSPYSAEASIGLVSSAWAVPELKKAEELGLIPDILKGADMTKPITREEFSELAVLLYEKVTGKAGEPVVPNPFSDTTNPQVLKAFKLGITLGTSSTTFSPEKLINREQCAAMLFRAIKAINPNGDYGIAGIKDFPDQKHISGWAVEATKYMVGKGIIKGNSNGEFMPKATTSVQEAQGYGMATREAAILMTVRAFEGMK